MIRTNFVHYRRLVDESIGNITYGVAIGENDTMEGAPSVSLVLTSCSGDPLPGGTTVLANVLQDGEWLEFTNEQHRRFVTEPSLIEQ